MAHPNEIVTTALETGVKSTERIQKFDIKTTENLELYRIGKPSRFPSSIDKGNRIRDYIESKMNIIDLIPCQYSLPLKKVLESKTWEDRNVFVDSVTPSITYEGAILDFRSLCKTYGLPYNHGGLRLYLTDETTATDEISNSFQDNWLGSQFNKFADARNHLSIIGRSVTDNFERAVREAGDFVESGARSAATTVFGGGQTDEDGNIIETSGIGQIASAAVSTAVSAAKIVASGNKLALPKVWSDSSYTPNFNAVVKLVSPYGHPDAIKEFIIKPLMYILMLCGAKSYDSISYGQSAKLTVKAYGITSLPLAVISGISLRKGGADTSFNIYRQPLSIDVSITFMSLIPGFAIETNPKNRGMFNNVNNLNENMTLSSSGTTFYSNMNTIIDSIKPVAVNNITRDYLKRSNRLPSKTSSEDQGYYSANESLSAENDREIRELMAEASVLKKPIESITQTTSEAIKRMSDDNIKGQLSNKIEEGLASAKVQYDKLTKNVDKLTSVNL